MTVKEMKLEEEEKQGLFSNVFQFSKQIVIVNTLFFWVVTLVCVAMIVFAPESAEYAKYIFTTVSTLYGSVCLMYSGKSAIENYNKIRGTTKIELEKTASEILDCKEEINA